MQHKFLKNILNLQITQISSKYQKKTGQPNNCPDK